MYGQQHQDEMVLPSHSYGAVITNKGDEGDGNPWWYISQPSQMVDRRVADTMCRQMGFTNVVSNTIMNLKYSNQEYGYNYNLDS